MHKKLIALTLIIGTVSLGVGIYCGAHSKEVASGVTAVVDNITPDDGPKDNEINMYGKPLTTVSNRENITAKLKIAEKNITERTTKTNNTKVDKMNTARKNYYEVNNLVNEVYAVIRQEKPKSKIDEFFKSEKSWMDSTQIKAVEESSKYTDAIDSSCNYYTTYTNDLKERYAYLVKEEMI